MSGTYEGNEGLWFVSQNGSCVTIEGFSVWPHEALGSRWRCVVTGELAQDFTVAGRLTWIYWRATPGAALQGDVVEVTLAVEFSSDDRPIIKIPSIDRLLGGAYTLSTLTRISERTVLPDTN